MKKQSFKRQARGYVSLLLVFSVSILMLTLMVFAYKRAVNAQAVLADIQTQTDYREKEETILRSIVAIVPNRAIQAMQSGSDSSSDRRDLVSFTSIFREALDQSNARTSISDELLAEMGQSNLTRGNSGDSALTETSRIFRPLLGFSNTVTAGLNRNFGDGLPPALNFDGTFTDDEIYPIITNYKTYGSYASGKVGLATDTWRDYNLIQYPQIDFGYAKPGEYFVAKRNWWAFRMNLAAHDDELTNLSRYDRTMVLSVYEIPSQLPISAGSYMALGQYGSGEAWQNVTISGTIFASRAVVEGVTSLESLASRRGFELSNSTTIGGQTFDGNPFAPRHQRNLSPDRGRLFPRISRLRER